MSFEYFFIPSNQPLEEAAIKDFFAMRRNYTVKNETAVYENLTTGVQFTFHFGRDLVEPTEDGLPVHETQIILFLDYLVPTFFAQEAALEVEAMMDTFDLRIFDPQESRMQNDLFDSEQFIKDYRKQATEAAVSLRANLKKGTWPATATRAALDRVWDWNYWRDDLQIALDEEIFVPPIQFVCHDGEMKTAVVWGDGVPALLPKVDVVLAGYLDIAPKSGVLRRQKRFLDLIPFDEFTEEFGDMFEPAEDVEGAVQMTPSSAEDMIERLKTRTPRAKQYFDAPARKRLFETNRPADVVDQELTEQP